MAFASDSTTAPALQPRLLPFTFRPTPPVDDPRSADELLEEIRRTIEGQEAFGFNRHDIVTDVDIDTPKPELPPEPLLPPALPSLTSAFSRRRAIFGAVALAAAPAAAASVPGDFPSTDFHLGAEARALHMRRELHRALDHGFALLDALDLPPLALDVIDDAIATLDALDAHDEDREEDDPAEGTSLERNGSGFVRCGADDDEDDDGPGNEDIGIGDDDGMQEHLVGWFRCPALIGSNGGYVA